MIQDLSFESLGIWQYGWTETGSIPFSEEVRSLCEQNTCRHYGRTWACPPAVGSVEECKKRCLTYKRMLVFSGKYDLEDSFDWEGMQRAHKEFKNTCDALYDVLKEYGERFLLLSNESCIRCETCTYPDAPCRYPELLFPSIESYGILVAPLAKQCNINYINGANTVTYFGGVLMDGIRE